MSTLLDVRNASAGYGERPVVHDLSFHVGAGEVVALLGANGAGKTTTLRLISGMLRTDGVVTFAGTPLGRLKPHRRAKLGLAHVPQGRGTLDHLTVHENLWAGGAGMSRRDRREAFDRWYDVFPRLADRRNQAAGSLSGGEQQLLAVARALMPGPKLVILDEPSLGLAPLMVAEVFEQLAAVNRDVGAALLVVEQNAVASLAVASRAYLMETGRIVREGTAADLAADDEVRRAYLGI